MLAWSSSALPRAAAVSWSIARQHRSSPLMRATNSLRRLFLRLASVSLIVLGATSGIGDSDDGYRFAYYGSLDEQLQHDGFGFPVLSASTTFLTSVLSNASLGRPVGSLLLHYRKTHEALRESAALAQLQSSTLDFCQRLESRLQLSHDNVHGLQPCAKLLRRLVRVDCVSGWVSGCGGRGG